MKSKAPILLFAGFGDIAQRLVAQLDGASQSFQLHAIKRNPLSAEQRQRFSVVNMHYMDLSATKPSDQATLNQLIEQISPDYILLALTPAEYSEQGYYDTYVKTTEALANSIVTANCNPVVFFISSTSVYGQNLGEWVDEDSTTQAQRYNGRLLLQAEHNLSSMRHCILRCSGLYTDLSQRMMALCSQISQRHWRWSNRIHRDDVAGFIAHLINCEQLERTIEPIYIVSDNEPTLLAPMLHELAVKLTITDAANTEQFISEWSRQTIASGKRCNNQRMRSTDFKLTYPNYRIGYNL